MGEARTKVGDFVSLRRGTTYSGMLVGKPGPALLGLGSIVPGGGFRHDFKTYGGDCPLELQLRPGDMYVSLKGATKDGEMIGSVARLPETVPLGRITQDTVKLEFRTPELAQKRFVYWILRTPQYREYCAGRAMGSAVVALSRDDFLTFPVPAMTKDRVAAVDLFERIEEKIELNRRMNETLEAMARALFKSWFVDFDPVRAKQRGEAPAGMDAATAALFPSRLVQTAHGEVPEGWCRSTLAEFLAQFGGTIQTGPFGSQLHAHDYVPSGIPVVMPQDINNRAVSEHRIARVREIDAERLARHQLDVGDLVFSRRGDVERHAFVTEYERGWLCGTGCLLIRPGSRSPAPTFLTFAMDAAASREHLVRHAVGATMPNLNTGILGGVPVVAPDLRVLEAFQRVVQPLETRRALNRHESRTLELLRDALLPSLLSGELRMPEAERAVAEVA